MAKMGAVESTFKSAMLQHPYLSHLSPEEREEMRRDWEQSQQGVGGGQKLHIDGIEELVGRHVREALREMAAAEAKALAGAAAEVPGLDALACSALADWLEEQSLPDVGALVRKMPLGDGDLLIIQPAGALTPEAMQGIRASAGLLEQRIWDPGRQGVIAVVPHGFSLIHLRTGKRSEVQP